MWFCRPAENYKSVSAYPVLLSCIDLEFPIVFFQLFFAWILQGWFFESDPEGFQMWVFWTQASPICFWAFQKAIIYIKFLYNIEVDSLYYNSLPYNKERTLNNLPIIIAFFAVFCVPRWAHSSLCFLLAPWIRQKHLLIIGNLFNSRS